VSVRSRLCAALLAAGRPVRTRDLAQALEIPEDEVPAATQDLGRALNEADLGLEVEAVAGGYRLVVHPSVVPHLHGFLAPPPLPHLSNAAIETLALVAYHQPITRGELESARGASCVSTLETLQERELVKVVGRKEVVGRPHLYATTDRFLIEFGLASLDDLPPLDEAPGAFLRG
jgi:segregation and condensation protein B